MRVEGNIKEMGSLEDSVFMFRMGKQGSLGAPPRFGTELGSFLLPQKLLQSLAYSNNGNFYIS